MYVWRYGSNTYMTEEGWSFNINTARVFRSKEDAYRAAFGRKATADGQPYFLVEVTEDRVIQEVDA